MSDQPLSGKVGLDTTDFKTGIAEMNRSIRVIESGFRASAAALGDWSKSASGLEQRIKSLTDQIGIQKSKVVALEAEYKRVAAEKGATSKAAQDLEIRLNKETETLNKMEGELGETQTALAGMGDESEEAGKGAEQLGKDEEKATGETSKLHSALSRLKDGLKSVAGDFRDLGDKVLKGLAVGLAGVAAGIAGAIAGIGAGVLKFAAASDEIVESAEKLGISAVQYQEFKYIGDQVGTSVEAIGKAFSKTTKLIGLAASGNKDAIKTIKDLGVSIYDANGNLRSAQRVTFDLISALGAMEDETARDILAQDIFGKGFQELAPLINLGADGAAKMTDQLRAMGGVMSEDAINAAADLHDKIGTLKAGFGGLIARLAGAFIPVISKVVDALMKWLANPKIQAGIKNLTDGIGKIAEIIGKVIDKLLAGDVRGALLDIFPKEMVDKIFNIASAIREFVTGTLIPFIREHWEELKAALISVGVVIGIVAPLIAIIGAVIAALTSPITLIVAAIALLAAAWTGNWGGIRTTITDWWETTGKPIFEQLADWLQVNLPIALETLKGFWLNVLQPALQTFWGWVQGTVFPILIKLWEWLATNIPAAIKTLSDYWTGTLLPAIERVWSWMSTVVFPFWESMANLLSAVVGVAVEALAGIWENVLQPALNTVYDFIKTNLQPLFQTFSDFFSRTFGPTLNTFRTGAWQKFQKGFETVKSLIDTVTSLFNTFADAIRNFELPEWMQRHSPSPFEMVFIGANEALEELTRTELPKLAARLNLIAPNLPAGPVPAISWAGNINNIQVTINAYGNAQPQAIGQAARDGVLKALRARGL